MTSSKARRRIYSKWLCLSNIASKAGMAELADAADSK
jgi:hypothetical protein